MSAQLDEPLLNLRLMAQSDLDEVLALEELVYEHPWSMGIFRDCLRSGYSCWALSLNERIIGYGVMSVVLDECHLLNICVHPEYQGLGLGRKIADRLLKLARQRGADTAFLEVRISNRSALKLYERIGFCEVGLRRGYYPAAKGREDAMVMALPL
ncbi:ribosomal protein S18-alanine N-acetyltransferase [endosymbiont of Lamellibrachia barhami]|uniref:ribosomal protein S18-alanine N-acetyltransferase n=1 Tax=endosymbiont of Lamellibrachia barhami TaxID=205975 RepID=UPI0034E24566